MRYKRISFLVVLAVVMVIASACATESLNPTSVPPTSIPPTSPSSGTPEIEEVVLGLGRGYIGEWWAVFFNEPSGSSDASTYVNGIDVPLANAIDQVQNTLDVVAFEMNNDVIYQAIRDAHERGVTVRIVTDDEHGIEDEKDTAIRDLRDAGVPVVEDGRSALMHNKFMIMDGQAVWTGSWNYTVNGTYRNNNNALVLQHPIAVAAYQAEFDEMFKDGEFGPTSTDDGMITFSEGDTQVSILFASEGNVIEAVANAVREADSDVRFMTFVFSSDSLGEAMIEAIGRGVNVQGVFENRNSTADWSMLPPLHCAGAHVRQDGNRYTLHHKTIIIDDDTVVTGSFNFSGNASRSNDENLVIIKDKVIAGLYLDEWQRMWDNAEDLEPDEVTCN